MRLADFILSDMEGILEDWQTFAATQLPAAASMSSLALRDHAQQILEAVAKDIVQPQTQVEQAQKSKGRAPQVMDAAARLARMEMAMFRGRALEWCYSSRWETRLLMGIIFML